MVSGQLRVAVIGSQTCHADTPLAYTVYRTSVNYRGLCYQRLIRFRHFSCFSKKLNLAPGAPRITVKLPPKIWWSRKASLHPETVEARQVLLNEFMQQAASRPLTPRSEERLLKLLQVGDYAPQEEEDRVINSRLSLKQQSATPTESASEILDAKCSILTATIEENEEEHSLQSEQKEKHPQDSLTDEEEPSLLQYQGEHQAEQNGADLSRQDSMASSNPASDDSETVEERSLSASLAPVMQVTTCPVQGSQNAKRALFESTGGSELLAIKEGGRDSLGSLSDYSSTPERHYFGQIKKCIASIEDIMDSSRKLEVRIRDKQAPGVQQA